MTSITENLAKITEFSQAEKNMINSKFSTLAITAKSTLVNIGQRTDKLYFIIKGCVRKYCLKDGNPVTLLIATEGEFVVEFVSFMNHSQSENVLEAIEDCELLFITKEDLEMLYHEIPKMNLVMRKVLEQVIYKTHLLLNSFIKLSPEERYLELLENKPEILNRVPQHILASYLGISATSLSRIRKRILNKQN